MIHRLFDRYIDWVVHWLIGTLIDWYIDQFIHWLITHSLIDLICLAYDESGNFLIYSSLLGIKFVNLTTQKVSRLLGQREHIRPLAIALFQVNNLIQLLIFLGMSECVSKTKFLILKNISLKMRCFQSFSYWQYQQKWCWEN